ncbi:hypothetical protein [Flavobacterium sp. CLA17]|nr:hypothetical protein [Flavobacterium sp. CLA17]
MADPNNTIESKNQTLELHYAVLVVVVPVGKKRTWKRAEKYGSV